MKTFVRGEDAPSWWANAIDAFLFSGSANLTLRRLAGSTTAVEVPAAAGDGRAAVSIKGLWRYITASINRAVPGGTAAGDLPVWACTGPQLIDNIPDENTDHTDYSWTLRITAAGAEPVVEAGVVEFWRQIGVAKWDGARITKLTQIVGGGGVGPDQYSDLYTVLPAVTANDDGRVIYFLADAANGIIWELRYRHTSPSAFKWEVTGARDLYAEVAAAEATANAGYVDLGTVGPSVTVPLAGDYMVALGFNPFVSQVAQEAYMGLSIAGGAAADVIRVSQQGNANGNIGALSRETPRPGLAAGNLLRAKYKTSGVSATFANRWLRVRPLRVG